MSRPDVEQRAAELRAERVPFVHATVVLADRPTSAKPGDEAIVYPDGTLEGFVGGTCAESTVRAQSLALLDSAEPLLLRITPTPEPDEEPRPDRLSVHNPCLSGGTLEIFLEPVVPAPMLVVHGESPIANALARLGERLGYQVAMTDSGQPPGDGLPEPDLAGVPGSAAVVCASHGRDEEPVLTAALRAGVEYVGLVASRKRGEAVVASLDVDEAERARVHTPAGLDIGARTPEEVALSILGEIVAERRRTSGRPIGLHPHQTHGPGAATDPVCGMSVATVETSLHLDHEGVRYWFCGTGCLRAFAADPAGYLSS
ncbi:MAG TPA: XdhC family protein [Nocardioidaceae bacterium]|nr:XdhC family protein [Nocardioidaceae bacterium]